MHPPISSTEWEYIKQRRNLKSRMRERFFARHTSHKYLMFPYAIKKYDKSNWSLWQTSWLVWGRTESFTFSTLKLRRIISLRPDINLRRKENIIKFEFFPYQHKNIIIIALLLDGGISRIREEKSQAASEARSFLFHMLFSATGINNTREQPSLLVFMRKFHTLFARNKQKKKVKEDEKRQE